MSWSRSYLRLDSSHYRKYRILVILNNICGFSLLNVWNLILKLIGSINEFCKCCMKDEKYISWKKLWLGLSTYQFLELYRRTKCGEQHRPTQRIAAATLTNRFTPSRNLLAPKCTGTSPDKYIKHRFFNQIGQNFVGKPGEDKENIIWNFHNLATKSFTDIIAGSS